MESNVEYEPDGSPTGPPLSEPLEPPTMPNYDVAGLVRKGRRPGTKNREGHKAGGPRPGAGRRPKPRGIVRPEATEMTDRECEARVFGNGYEAYSPQSPPQSTSNGQQGQLPQENRNGPRPGTPIPSNSPDDEEGDTSKHRRRSSIYKVLNMPLPYESDRR